MSKSGAERDQASFTCTKADRVAVDVQGSQRAADRKREAPLEGVVTPHHIMIITAILSITAKRSAQKKRSGRHLCGVPTRLATATCARASFDTHLLDVGRTLAERGGVAVEQP